MAVSPEWVRFWQLLLLAELPLFKLEAAFREVDRSPSEADAIERLRGLAVLSEPERKRVSPDPSHSVDAALKLGASFQRSIAFNKPALAELKQIPGLFQRGDLNALKKPLVAIVGTRSFSPYGEAASRKFAQAFADAGACVVSGGALGIDSAAHKGALEAKGLTIAVLPCGIDKVYPPANRHLLAKVAESGLLLSQFPCGFTPRRESFLLRNIVIAAICDALLVVEAPEKSGALHTAARANDFGKPVYVVPAAISQASFRGSHGLIRSGATLVDHPDQVLEDLQIMRGERRATQAIATNGAQDRILSLLGDIPISVESISEKSGLEPDIVLSELTMLELEGSIVRGVSGITKAL